MGLVATSASVPGWAVPALLLGEVEVLTNLTLSYGALYRLHDQNDDLVAIVNGGTRPSADSDDGDLNYDPGIASNMLRASGEVLLAWRSFGAYARATAFYDYENQDEQRARTQLTARQKDLVGSDVDVKDAYLTFSQTAAGMPVMIRAGRQVVNWSETSFLREGLDLINPVDSVAATQAARDRQDLRVPQGMVWAAAIPTEILSVEAFYQYEWKSFVSAPVGGYFSAIDLLGGDGLNKAVFGAGQVSDLGTDLDRFFELPAGTLGFDPLFQQLPGTRTDEPDDAGQYGIALFAVLPTRNAVKAGLHYVRYHNRLPIVSGVTADAEAVAATSVAAVRAQAAALVPAYESEGLDPAEAAQRAEAAAEQLVLSGYVNAASYVAEYPEDIDAFGLTFSTSTARTGTLVSGEITYHRDYPFQVALGTVLDAVLSPVLFDPSIGETPLGSFGPSEPVSGVKRLDRTQATLELAQVFRGWLWADRFIVGVNAGISRVHDLPGSDEAPLTSDDATSWGYGLWVQSTYSGLFGGVNLTPRLAYTRDVDGTTPGPLGAFVEDRKSFTVGFEASYIDRFSVDLSYVDFFGAGAGNQLRDRDYVRFELTWSVW